MMACYEIHKIEPTLVTPLPVEINYKYLYQIIYVSSWQSELLSLMMLDNYCSISQYF